MPRNLPWWIAALLILLAAGLSFRGVAPSYPYGYDEADYMYAGTRGFAANYLDRNAMSFPAFVQKGLELMRTPGKRSSFSEYIRSVGDINMYRHFHGPVFAYWIALGQSLGLDGPGQFRSSGLVIHLVTTLTSMLVFWWLFPSLPAWGALVAGVLIGFNRTALFTSMLMSQHLAFILVCLLTLAAAGRFLRDFNPRYFYAMMALLAVAYATVESAAFLTLGLAVTLFLARRKLLLRFEGWRGVLYLTLRGILAWCLALLVCWPMGLLNLNVLKGFLAMGYIAVSRKTFSPISFPEMWQAKFVGSPWEYSAFLVALPLLWLCRRRLPRESWPFLCYAVVFMLITVKMTVPYTHYLGSFTITCAMILAIAVSCQPSPAGPILAAALALTAVPMAVSYRAEAIEAQADHPHLAQVLAFVAHAPAAERWVVPYDLVPLLHLHHPELHLTAYDIDWDLERLTGTVAETPATSVLCAPQTCALIQNALGAQRFTDPLPVAQPTRTLLQPLAALEHRSPQ